jgi:hypothetical protein
MDRSSSARTAMVRGRSLYGEKLLTQPPPVTRTVTFATQDQLTAHNARAVVLSCMDFRLIDDQVKLLNSLGYNNNYDALI